MLRRTLLALLNTVPLSFAAKWFPDSAVAASQELFRHRGWDLTWTEYGDSKTSIGAWMATPVSTAAGKHRFPFRVLVPRPIEYFRASEVVGKDGFHQYKLTEVPNPVDIPKAKTKALNRLEYLIASQSPITRVVPAEAPPPNYPKGITGEIGDNWTGSDGQSWIMSWNGWKPLPWVSLPADPKELEREELRAEERGALWMKYIAQGDIDSAAKISGVTPEVLRDFLGNKFTPERLAQDVG